MQQYRLVSQSFEQRVLDLQTEIKKRDENIAKLMAAEDGVVLADLNHVKNKGACDFSIDTAKDTYVLLRHKNHATNFSGLLFNLYIKTSSLTPTFYKILHEQKLFINFFC